MICIIAFVVFGILGVFSAAYRKAAFEAMDCVFRRITLRKCESRLDERLKSQITGKLMKKSPKVASWTFKHFEIISWIFTILLIASIAYSGYSIYNLVVYENCNGPESTAFCVFDPFAMHQPDVSLATTGISCSVAGVEKNPESLIFPQEIIEDKEDYPHLGNPDAKLKIIEFGCFTCENTEEAAPIVKRILYDFKDQVEFIFVSFPLSSAHDNAYESSLALECLFEQDPAAYWDYHFAVLGDMENVKKEGIPYLKALAHTAIGTADKQIDYNEFEKCLDSEKYKEKIESQIEIGKDTGLYGTPTFFIGEDKKLVGPHKYGVFKHAIQKELNMVSS